MTFEISISDFAADASTKYSPQQKLSLKVKIGDVEKVEEGILFTEATFIS